MPRTPVKKKAPVVKKKAPVAKKKAPAKVVAKKKAPVVKKKAPVAKKKAPVAKKKAPAKVVAKKKAPVAKKKAPARRAVTLTRERIGMVAVDAGMLMVCDPCYIDSHWKRHPFDDVRRYRDTTSGRVLTYGKDFKTYVQPLRAYGGLHVNDLLEQGRLEEVPEQPTGEFSYDGACRATLTDTQHGELTFRGGAAGAAVAFASGLGDGTYEVFAEKVVLEDLGERIVRVTIELIPELAGGR
jgi:hypothetical protein